MFKGRTCDSLQKKQQIEIEKLGLELVANAKAIALLKKEVSQLDAFIDNCNELNKVSKQELVVQKEKFKVKIRKLIRVVIVEGVAIVVLIIILV